MSGPLTIQLNGQPHELPAEMTVADLIAARNLQPVRVAVEINEKLVRRANFDSVSVRPGDRVEIVTLVGGG